jgi:hypothetical protein
MLETTRRLREAGLAQEEHAALVYPLARDARRLQLLGEAVERLTGHAGDELGRHRLRRGR